MTTSLQTIRTVVVDDEPLARECVVKALEKGNNFEVVAQCAEGKDAVRTINREQPDLVFLDIQMPGMTGLEVVEKLGIDSVPALVFVTAYDAHAIQAFELHAIDYVLKPFDDQRLLDAAARAAGIVRAEQDADLRRRLSLFLSETGLGTRGELREKTAHNHVSVRVGDSYRLIPPTDIDWFDVSGNYVRLHCGEESHVLRTTMASLVGQLESEGFVRVHRSTALNVNRIREIKPWFGGDYVAILRDGSEHRVSRVYRDGLLKRGG